MVENGADFAGRQVQIVGDIWGGVSLYVIFRVSSGVSEQATPLRMEVTRNTNVYDKVINFSFVNYADTLRGSAAGNFY